ncbi:MAG: hypothetical protein AVDCRST_MAG89-5234, partial [uncultured Gemmatimonadetes bacterium]
GSPRAPPHQWMHDHGRPHARGRQWMRVRPRAPLHPPRVHRCRRVPCGPRRPWCSTPCRCRHGRSGPCLPPRSQRRPRGSCRSGPFRAFRRL